MRIISIYFWQIKAELAEEHQGFSTFTDLLIHSKPNYHHVTINMSHFMQKQVLRKIFVVVITKEGQAGTNTTKPSFGITPTMECKM